MGKNKIKTNSVVHRSKDLVSSNMDGEIVMMSIEKGEYFGLDIIGSRIWNLIENPISVAQLIETLLGEFEVSKEQCERDVFEFLNDLLKQELIFLK